MNFYNGVLRDQKINVLSMKYLQSLQDYNFFFFFIFNQFIIDYIWRGSIIYQFIVDCVDKKKI